MPRVIRQLFKLAIWAFIILWLFQRSDRVGAFVMAPYTLGLGVAASVELQQIRAALIRHRQIDGALPTGSQFQGFVRSSFSDPAGDPTLDSWGNTYGYTVAPNGRAFHVWSAGPDGRHNTQDDIRLRWEEST
jgi:hypothetical protein